MDDQCHNLPVNNFEQIEELNEDFIKNYYEKSDEEYFLEVDVHYPEKIYELHNNLPFLPERKKLKKVERLFTNLHYKNECYSHIKESIK